MVQSRFCLKLSGCADYTKRRRIRATQRIRERIISIHIRCSDNRADVGARCCVLREGARRCSRCKTRCLVDICNIDGDGDAICQTPIGNGDRDRVGIFRFMVKG